jgi:hypothetical protein
MTPQQEAKQASELISLFREEYKQHTGHLPLLNIAKEKWAARDLVQSFGIEDCKRAVQWYFKSSKRYDWKTFTYIADQCVSESKSVEEDIAKRRKFRKIAKEWRDS